MDGFFQRFFPGDGICMANMYMGNLFMDFLFVYLFMTPLSDFYVLFWGSVG